MNPLYQNIDVFREIFKQMFIMSNYSDGKFDHDENRAIRKFGITIQKLTCVDTYLNNIMSDIERAQKIVTEINKLRKYKSKYEIMRFLSGGIYVRMANKIDNLFEIVFDKNRMFNDEDLNDVWILNAKQMLNVDNVKNKLIPYKDLSIRKPSLTKFKNLVCCYKTYSLLEITFLTKNFDKMKMLLEAGVAIDSSILLDIAKNRSLSKYKQKHYNNRTYYLTVAQLLLGKDATIDKELSLMIAAHNDDEEYAFLLLKYGADPYKSIKIAIMLSYPFYHEREEKMKNTFDVTAGKDWFNRMIKDMKI